MATLYNKLNELYKICAAYSGGHYNQPLIIIDEAGKIYIEHENELPANLKEPLGKCVSFINHNLEKDITFEEYCEFGEELIEDIIGCVGEYLA